MQTLAYSGLASGMVGLYVGLIFLSFFFVDRVIRGRYFPAFLLISFFLLGASVTILGQNMVYIASSRSAAETRIWEQIQHVGLFILFPVWIHFIFLHVLRRKARLYILSIYAFSAFCILATFSTHWLFVVSPVKFKDFLSFDTGPLYTPVAGFLFVNIIVTFVILLADLRRSSGRERLFKLIYVIGSGLTIVTGLKDLLETWIETPLPQLFSYGILLAAFAYLAAIVLRLREMYMEYLLKHDMETEFRIASKAQSIFIPEKISVDTSFLEARGMNRPGRFLGGDIYHCGLMADQRYLVLTGDLCGKGLAASLYMHFLLSYFVGLEGVADAGELERVIAKANKLFCRRAEPGMFATLFAAVLDPAARTAVFVNAGHTFTRFYRDGGMTLLNSPGMPLGIDPEARFTSASIDLKPGDRFFLFTDGLQENLGFMDRDEDFDRLSLEQSPGQLDEAVRTMLSRALVRKPDGVFQDDMTCLFIRIKSLPGT